MYDSGKSVTDLERVHAMHFEVHAVLVWFPEQK